MVVKNFFRHLKTVHRHRKEVRKLMFKVGLYWRGLVHDLSKYSPTEFFSSVRYYQGWRSPIDNEIDTIGYSKAWLHHKGRNKHHPEYWFDSAHGGIFYGTLRGTICEMPMKYRVEMICDRIAASKVYLGDKYTDSSPLEYTMRRMKVEKHWIEPKTYDWLLTNLRLLANNGEKYFLKDLKNCLKCKTRDCENG